MVDAGGAEQGTGQATRINVAPIRQMIADQKIDLPLWLIYIFILIESILILPSL